MASDANRQDEKLTKVGWRPKEWARDTGLSRLLVYKILQRGGPIEAVRHGTAVIITTSPAEFLARLRGA